MRGNGIMKREIALNQTEFPLIRVGILLLSLLLWNSLLVTTQAQTAEDFKYSIADGQVTITEYIGSSEDVIVPSSIESYPVTVIDGWAFTHQTTIQSITLPDTIQQIGLEAFSYCRGLTSFTFGGQETTILGYAFYGCNNLTEIKLPNTVTSIGSYAFCGCLSITEFTIPEGIANIEQGTFYKCSSLMDIQLPDSLISIGANAFAECSALETIDIPSNVTTIDPTALEHCNSLQSILVSENNLTYSTSADGVLYNKEQTTLLRCPGGYDSKTFFIPATLTSIKDGAFLGCIQLKTFEVDPENPVYSSNADGFLLSKDQTILYASPAGKTGILVIPEGITTIANDALNGSTGLIAVICPTTLTSLGERSFWFCTSLVSMGFHGEAPSIETIPPLYNVTTSLKVYYEADKTGWTNTFSGYSAYLSQDIQVLTYEPITTEMTYGDPDFTLTGSSSSLLKVTFASTETDVATVDGSTVHITGAGTTDLSCIQLGGYKAAITYFPAYTNQTLTVLPKPATITTHDVSMEYGNPFPSFTYTVDGLLEEDILEGTAVICIDDVPEEEITTPLRPGTYKITTTGLSNPNYTLTNIAGTLTVVTPVLEPTISAAIEDDKLVITFTGILQVSTDGGKTWTDTPATEAGKYTEEIPATAGSRLFRTTNGA